MEKMNQTTNRETCYKCYRPQASCICDFIKKPINTNTKFVILMHPKEYRKTKNGTGHMTRNSLINSELYVGIDFSNHNRVNELINDTNYESYILYPGENSISLNNENIKSSKNLLLFIIDSTWPCSRKILRVSKNLQKIKRLSFTHKEISNFKIKTQPKNYCLSTIESTKVILQLLNEQKIEDIENESLSEFLNPFEQMVNYQLDFTSEEKKSIRYKENLST
jgi:DTW domain-containing protein YfiP